MNKLFLSVVLPILVFSIILGSATAYTLLEAFVLDREIAVETIDRRPIQTPVTTGQGSGKDDPTNEAPPTVDYPIIEDRYYKDENIEITIDEIEYNNHYGIANKVFIIDLKLSSVEYLRTFVNTSSSGKIKTETVSDMAKKNNAIFAINGDYFSFRNQGLVLRDYTKVYFKTARKSSDDDALCILENGAFLMLNENDLANSRGRIENIPSGAYQIFSFGPHLVLDGEIAVKENQEVGQAAAANPRTAIGIIEPLHYKIVVAEGRLHRYGGRDGLKLYELAEIMQDLGCTNAYNLDGGSSTTLYFNGRVLNELPDDERNVSDCIFINGVSYSEAVTKG